jgi:hypothetical protein
MDRQASVSVKADWVVLDEFELNKLAKLKLEGTMPKEKDVLWCGFVDQYNEAYDKISTKVRFYVSPAVLKQSFHRKRLTISIPCIQTYPSLFYPFSE